jgi:hypothetical protein
MFCELHIIPWAHPLHDYECIPPRRCKSPGGDSNGYPDDDDEDDARVILLQIADLLISRDIPRGCRLILVGRAALAARRRW